MLARVGLWRVGAVLATRNCENDIVGGDVNYDGDDYVGVGDATDAFGCDVVDEGLAMPMAMATVSVVVVAM